MWRRPHSVSPRHMRGVAPEAVVAMPTASGRNRWRAHEMQDHDWNAKVAHEIESCSASSSFLRAAGSSLCHDHGVDRDVGRSKRSRKLGALRSCRIHPRIRPTPARRSGKRCRSRRCHRRSSRHRPGRPRLRNLLRRRGRRDDSARMPAGAATWVAPSRSSSASTTAACRTSSTKTSCPSGRANTWSGPRRAWPGASLTVDPVFRRQARACRLHRGPARAAAIRPG